MIAYRPALRGELVYVQKDGGDDALYDPIVNRQVSLGAIARAIVARLDGRRTVDEVLDEVVADVAVRAALSATGPSELRPTVEHTFRTLLLMNLVHGAGTQVLLRVAAVRNRETPLEPLFLDESRFACQGSGGCCQSYSFGPLDDDDVARIEALDIASAFPHLKDQPIFDVQEWKNDGAERVLFLNTVEDRCVFLDGDRRCGLHARFGADSKPRFCRLYPLEAWPTVDGLKVYDRGECTSFATASRDGLRLQDDFARVRALLPKDRQLQHPIVFLDGKTPCDYGWFLMLQRSMCELVGARLGDAGTTLRAVARAMRSFFDALAACPLRRGEPDATVEQLLARDPRQFYAPAAAELDGAERRAGLAAIGRIAGELVQALTPEIAAHGPSSVLPRELGAIVHLIQALATHRAEPGKHPSIADCERAMGMPVDEREVDAVLRISFRQQLFGSRMLIDERPVPALGRMVFVYLITMIGAKLRATVEGAARVEARHLSGAHVVAVRMLRQRSKAELFLGREAEVWSMAAAAPSLVEPT